MGTIFTGTDTHRATEREEAARQKLYEHNRELRGALLDVLTLLRAHSDPWGARAEIPIAEPERLRLRALEIEHHDAIIQRAREILDRTRNLRHLIGKLPSETQDDDLPNEPEK